MAEFDKALSLLLGFEGGYSNDPRDPGGETVCGITRKNYPNWPGWRLVPEARKQNPKNLLAFDPLRQAVAQFYRETYWDPAHLGSFPTSVAAEILEFSVNAGAGTVAKAVQRACNLCNNRGDF